MTSEKSITEEPGLPEEARRWMEKGKGMPMPTLLELDAFTKLECYHFGLSIALDVFTNQKLVDLLPKIAPGEEHGAHLTIALGILAGHWDHVSEIVKKLQKIEDSLKEEREADRVVH